MGTARAPSRTVLVLAVVFAMIFPSVMTWLYFQALVGTTGQLNLLQQIAYGTGKAVQFSFPLLFVWLTTGRFPFLVGAASRAAQESPARLAGPTVGAASRAAQESPARLAGPTVGAASRAAQESPARLAGPTAQDSRAAGVGLGLGFGLLVVGFIFVVYFGFLRDAPVLANLPGKLRLKLEEFGVASPGAYLALGVFIAVLHSLLEEYYWRWFVFGRLRELIPPWTAIAVSSLAFMAHHVIVLYKYLPDQIWYGVLPFSLGVAVGGAFWAWLYQRSGTLLGPWLSHLLVDAGIFVIGWDLLRRSAG